MHERGGQNPVNISSPVDRRESSGNFFDPSAASSGEHQQVSKGGNSGDSHGEDLEEFASRDSLCSHVEVQGGEGHAGETNEETPVSEVAKIVLHWVGVFLNPVEWSKILSPLWANCGIEEFFSRNVSFSEGADSKKRNQIQHLTFVTQE